MILITGSSGFIGRAVCQQLQTRGLSFVTAVRGQGHSVSEHCLAVGEFDGCTIWSQALSGVDAVVHLAARVHIMNDQCADPLSEYRRVNVEGTRNLAMQAASAGVKRFIFLSSIKVNGESTQPGHKYLADDLPKPSDAYAISKHEAEQALFGIARETGMEVVIVRSPLVYGPGVKANFEKLMNAVLEGWPLPLDSVCHNRRSLVCVDNLVDFIFTCLNHPAAANQIFLVSDDEDLSTADLFHRMCASVDVPDRSWQAPVWLLRASAILLGKSGAYQRLCGSLQVDIDKSKQLLGWTPPVSVDEGLRRAFKGY